MNRVRVIYPFKETFTDYPDDESLAVEIYMMGCDNRCVGCQNPDFADQGYRVGTREMTVSELIEELVSFMAKCRTNKLVIEGGDPLYQGNIKATLEILDRLGKDYDICLYTGHDIDYVKKNGVKGFRYIKCGKFLPQMEQATEKNDEYIQYASSNQALYDESFCLLSREGRYYFQSSKAECLQK